MDYREIDEISDAFLEAWVENFAQPMEYVKYSDENIIHPVYGEQITGKKYDEEEAVVFHGTLKETEFEETGNIYGKNNDAIYEITLITKELKDRGIERVRHEDLVITSGRKFNIIGYVRKVQFLDQKIFTKLKVVEVYD